MAYGDDEYARIQRRDSFNRIERLQEECGRLQALLELGQAVAGDIVRNSVYSGETATYANHSERSARLALFAEGNLERLREFTKRAAQGKSPP